MFKIKCKANKNDIEPCSKIAELSEAQQALNNLVKTYFGMLNNSISDIKFAKTEKELENALIIHNRDVECCKQYATLNIKIKELKKQLGIL